MISHYETSYLMGEQEMITRDDHRIWTSELRGFIITGRFPGQLGSESYENEGLKSENTKLCMKSFN